MRKPTVIHRCQGPIYALIAATDRLWLGTGSGMVLEWSPTDPERIRLVAQVPAPVFALGLAGERSLAVGAASGELFFLSLDERSADQRLVAHANGIHAIVLLPDGRLATGGSDGALGVWTARSGRWALERRIPLSEGKLRGLSVSPDGARLAVACGDGPVRLVETALFNETATYGGHEGGAYAVAFHPAKPVLMSGGKDGHLRGWSAREDGRAVVALPAHRSTIYGLAFDGRGAELATASRDKTVKLWDAMRLDPLERLEARTGGHTHSVNALAWLGADLFTAGDDGRLIRWAQKG